MAQDGPAMAPKCFNIGGWGVIPTGKSISVSVRVVGAMQAGGFPAGSRPVPGRCPVPGGSGCGSGCGSRWFRETVSESESQSE